jgi:phosphohistidine swiveling domain-containing protein
MQHRTKAQTLQALQGIRQATVLDALVYSYAEWSKEPESLLQKARQKAWKLFAVRSSATTEDQEHTSNAGKYTTLLNVSWKDLKGAIETVFASYAKDSLSPKDEVLLQPMLQDAATSGVLFTKDPNRGAPYYVINVSHSSDTTAVTSGGTSSLETTFIARCAPLPKDPKIQKLLALAQELETALSFSALDIEFAFDKKGDLFLFQVRPLICKEQSLEDQSVWLEAAAKRFAILNREHPYLSGKRTLCGVMPDWNPAEMIGTHPKPLALSLYKELITNAIWAYQRDNYGYQNLRSFPLLIDFVGIPYIDVRVSFSSFLPKTLSSSLSHRLVDHYLDTLEASPHLHDKIEFEIAHSCYTFDLAQRLESLKGCGFLPGETQQLQDALRDLTNEIIRNDTGIWTEDVRKIETLKERHERILCHPHFDIPTKIYWMLEDCKRYGTLPFAGLARAGFIAVQLLNSMVSVGVLSKDQRLSFLNSLNSVSSQMAYDLSHQSRARFLEIYGHLRPGTYDILSPRYDEAPDLYFDWENAQKQDPSKRADFSLSIPQMQKVEQLLKEHRLEHNVVGLFTFMKAAIEGREYSKFVFTKTLSDVLNLLKELGASYALDAEALSYVDIQTILSNYTTSWDIGELLHKSVELGKERYRITSQTLLPPLITGEEDFYVFSLPTDQPNFITRQSVTAPVLTDLTQEKELGGKILFIPGADPGFDWIFTHGISGFVTTYGGVNSHMAIRAGELGLPAIIGAGEKLYAQWAQAQTLHIDCANQKVEIIR